MRFNSGDLVIRTTGGDKMRVFEIAEDGMVTCIYASEKKLHLINIKEDELVTVSDFTKIEKRNDILNSILNK